jgi:hypothetical protein
MAWGRALQSDKVLVEMFDNEGREEGRMEEWKNGRWEGWKMGRM